MIPKLTKKIIKESITKDYKLADDNTINHINDEAARILSVRNVKKKIPKYVTNEAFITLKDHKQNFPHTIKCRTINPAKSHVGKWCKIILQKHQDRIRSKSGLTQWKNSMEVTKWFEKLNDKRSKCFINFDILEFYPSITKLHLIDAIKFSKEFTKFSDDDTELILHACQSVLFH